MSYPGAAVPDTFAAERMRAIRRDSYRCQYRYPGGRPCEKRSAHVEPIDPGLPLDADNLRTVCRGSH